MSDTVTQRDEADGRGGHDDPGLRAPCRTGRRPSLPPRDEALKVKVPSEPLTLRRLNRATLARQALLERASVGAAEMIERLVGLQSQLASSPYIGLWTRLEGFSREELADLIAGRAVVKATLMRATLTITPFARFDKKTAASLTEEGERLLRFIEPDAKGYEVSLSRTE